MNILYLTSAIEQKDYEEFQKSWMKPLNCSNQLFHSRLISSLSNNNVINVISFRPFNKMCSMHKLEYEEKENGNIKWFYLKEKKNTLFNYFSVYKQFDSILFKLTNIDIVLFDSMNVIIGSFAQKLKSVGYKIIPVCTDLPENIQGVNQTYIDFVYKHSLNADGYIALSEGLNEKFNHDGKPYAIVNGILTNQSVSSKELEYENYFLFSGALMKKYGLYTCIDAFKKLNNPKIKLLLCGHHGDVEYLKDYIKDSSNIIFLGYIENDLVRKYETNSIANICPRPLNENIDLYSIPSKCIEYLSSGSILISTKNPLLMPLFKEEVLWSDEDENSLKDQMIKAISLSKEERKELTNKAKEKMNKLYSPDEIANKLGQLFSKIIG